MYFEIYDPLLTGETPPKVSIQMRFLDAKTGAPVTETGTLAVDSFVQAGKCEGPDGTEAAGEHVGAGVLPHGN